MFGRKGITTLYKGARVRAKDRGPVHFKTPLTVHEGDIMSIAKRNVVTITPITAIKTAASIMVKHSFRRLPIVDAGTNLLLGIITSTDIVDFFGGGDKFQIIRERYQGNLLAAFNEAVREIMVKDVVTVTNTASINETLEKMFINSIGGVPVVTHDYKVVGIVTEMDFVKLLTDKFTGKKVEELMTIEVITAPPGMSILDAARLMIRNGFRRLPVVRDENLIGILASTDIIAFIGKNIVFKKISTTQAEEALKTRIEEIMTEGVMTTEPSADLGSVAKTMIERHTGALPVAEDEKLVGLITERDLLFSLIQEVAPT